jgi:hypothetical protein
VKHAKKAAMNKILSWVVENSVGIVVGLWFLSSLIELTDIAFTVRHSDTETKVIVETPQKPKATDKATDPSPRTTDTPHTTW